MRSPRHHHTRKSSNKSVNHLHKSEITIYICEWINVKYIAIFEYCMTIPYLGRACSEFWEQVYAPKYSIHPDDACAPPPIPSWLHHLIHFMFGVRRCKWWEPLDIGQVRWGVQWRSHISNGSFWDLEHHSNLSNAHPCEVVVIRPQVWKISYY